MDKNTNSEKFCIKRNVVITKNSSVNGNGNEIDFDDILTSYFLAATMSGVPFDVDFIFLNTNNITDCEVKNIICDYNIPIFPVGFNIEMGTLPYIQNKYACYNEINDILTSYCTDISKDNLSYAPMKNDAIYKERNRISKSIDDMVEYSLTSSLPESQKFRIIRYPKPNVERLTFENTRRLSGLNIKGKDIQKINSIIEKFALSTEQTKSANIAFFQGNRNSPQPVDFDTLPEQQKAEIMEKCKYLAGMYSNYLTYELALKKHMLYENLDVKSYDILNSLHITTIKDANGNALHYDNIFGTPFIENRHQDIIPHVDYLREFLELYDCNLKYFGPTDPPSQSGLE